MKSEIPVKVKRLETELKGEDEKSPFITIEYERNDENGFNKMSAGDIGSWAEIEIRENKLLETLDIKLTAKARSSVFRICLSNEMAEALIRAVRTYAQES